MERVGKECDERESGREEKRECAAATQFKTRKHLRSRQLPVRIAPWQGRCIISPRGRGALHRPNAMSGGLFLLRRVRVFVRFLHFLKPWWQGPSPSQASTDVQTPANVTMKKKLPPAASIRHVERRKWPRQRRNANGTVDGVQAVPGEIGSLM